MGRLASIRREKLIEGVLQGKTPATAARDAGYSDSYARVDVYRALTHPDIRQRIEARIQEAQVDSDEVIGTLVSHMRADLADILPENEILQRAREAGFSHLIKKIRIRERFISQGPGNEPIREATTELELHDSQAAAKVLANLIAMENAPPEWKLSLTDEERATRIAELLSLAQTRRREHLAAADTPSSPETSI
jgi:hypothetical protein